MIPKVIRVFPLSKTKEPEDFGTIDKLYEYFCGVLPSRRPPGRFNIPSKRSHFEKNSLVLFQYAEKKDEEKIIAHAMLISDGCVPDGEVDGYIGYYVFDPNSINVYKNPITKDEIHNIWKRKLCQSKLRLDISNYCEYKRLLKKSGNLVSRCN